MFRLNTSAIKNRTIQILSIYTLLAFCFVKVAYAQGGQILSAVYLIGNSKVSDEQILNGSILKVGETFNIKSLNEEVKRVYRLGFFNSVSAQLSGEGRNVKVTLEIGEKPSLIGIKFSGNEEFDEDELKEKLALENARFIDQAQLDKGMERLVEEYQKEGYYDVEVIPELKEKGVGVVELEVRIKEGAELKIREVRILGGREIEEEEVGSELNTRPYSWWKSWILSTGFYIKSMALNDKEIIKHFYLTKGYVDVRVADPEVKKLPEGLAVVFKVEEGKRFKFGKVKASGNLLNGKEAQTLDGVETIDGEVFNIDQITSSVQKIVSKFADVGYAFANVMPMTKINRDVNTVDLTYAISKGDLYKVGKIDIEGNGKTWDNVIRRNFKLEENDLYAKNKIDRSKELVKRLGYFEDVTVNMEKSTVPGYVDLKVGTKEMSTGEFNVGAGLSSGEGAFFTVGLNERNLFGSGNSLGLNINAGTERESYALNFINPRVLDTYLSVGTEISATEREYDDFMRKAKGGEISFGYPLWFLGEDSIDDYRVNLAYELINVEIADIDEDAPLRIIEEEGETMASSLTPRFIRNTIDNPINPTIGSKQMLSYKYAGIGGDEKYWILGISNAWYYPLAKTSFGDFVFANRVRYDYGKSMEDENLPLFERFFPGGINSVRGYESRELGPRDQNGDEYGGSTQLIANYEFIFPILKDAGLKGLIFFDAGQSFDDEEQVRISDLRRAYGWGVRWYNPIMPVRIEIGYPVGRKSGEDSVVTNFSFGAPSW